MEVVEISQSTRINKACESVKTVDTVGVEKLVKAIQIVKKVVEQIVEEIGGC